MTTWLVDATSLAPSRLLPPASKSDAQRALVLEHILGEPGWSGLSSLQNEPADVQTLARGLATLNSPFIPTEGDGAPVVPQDIDCRDGGAPLRILLGQASVTPGAVVRLQGTARLRERPLQPLLDALREGLGPSGLEIEDPGHWPLLVRAPRDFRPAYFRVDASQSSQFATSLLLAGAALTFRHGFPSGLQLTGPAASAGYLALTQRWLLRAGFELMESPQSFAITGWHEPTERAEVPGDWSSLGYLLLVAWKTGSAVDGVDLNAEHPDRAIVGLLERAGLSLEREGDGSVRVLGKATRGIEVSGAECPDLLPTLAAWACVLPQPSRLTNVGILRDKESDRLSSIRELVRAAGGTTRDVEGDSIEIQPPTALAASWAFDSRGDHRMAMSAATLAVLTHATVSLRNPECVAKSFPRFWAELSKVGVRTVEAPEC